MGLKDGKGSSLCFLTPLRKRISPSIGWLVYTLVYVQNFEQIGGLQGFSGRVGPLRQNSSYFLFFLVFIYPLFVLERISFLTLVFLLRAESSRLALSLCRVGHLPGRIGSFCEHIVNKPIPGIGNFLY